MVGVVGAPSDGAAAPSRLAVGAPTAVRLRGDDIPAEAALRLKEELGLELDPFRGRLEEEVGEHDPRRHPLGLRVAARTSASSGSAASRSSAHSTRLSISSAPSFEELTASFERATIPWKTS